MAYNPYNPNPQGGGAPQFDQVGVVQGRQPSASKTSSDPNGGLGWNPWKGPKNPLGAYKPTVGSQDSLYRDPSQGDSPWMAMQTERIKANTGRSQDEARASAASAGANAWGQLAEMGGVRSGTAQNVAENAAYQGMMGAQDAGFQGSDQLLQSGLQDAAINADNQRFDVTNRIGDAQGRNEYDLGKYNTEMQAWASGQAAEAMRNSGKK